MVDLAVISGSSFYLFTGLKKEKDVEVPTKFGKVSVQTGIMEDLTIAFIFMAVIQKLVKNYWEPKFGGFVYTFE